MFKVSGVAHIHTPPAYKIRVSMATIDMDVVNMNASLMAPINMANDNSATILMTAFMHVLQ